MIIIISLSLSLSLALYAKATGASILLIIQSADALPFFSLSLSFFFLRIYLLCFEIVDR